MKRGYFAACLALVILALAACQSIDSSTEALPGKAVSALSFGGLSRYPIWPGDKKSTWQGDSVQLMAADAWAGCSIPQTGDVMHESLFRDPYLNKLAEFMEASYSIPCFADYSGSVLTDWLHGRSNPACNGDQDGLTGKVDIKASPLRERINIDSFGFGPVKASKWQDAVAAADADVRMAGINLCMALRLREAAPGAMGAESLLLSGYEQIELLELIKERTQLAMLQYAQLGAVFASPSTDLDSIFSDSTFDPTMEQRVPVLLKWIELDENVETIDGMGKDFATSVQLHSVVSNELAELLARNASAGVSRGGSAASKAESEFGSASWRQRAMASLYGGDPLTQAADDSTPWHHPTGKILPSADGSFDWPDGEDLPYVKADIQSPGPSYLIGLARGANEDSNGALNLRLVSSGSCYLVDQEASANRLYRAVERSIRQKQCDKHPAGNPSACALVSLEEIPTDIDANFGGFSVWNRYKLTPSDARNAVKLLAGFVEPVCTGTTVVDVRPGARDLSGTVSLVYLEGYGQDPWSHISSDAQFLAPRLPEIAPQFTKLANDWRLPSALDVMPLAAVAHLGFCPLTGSQCNHHETMRLMGANPAAVAVRQSLLESAIALQQFPKSAVNGYFSLASKILGVSNALVGEGQVTIRPVMQYGAGFADGKPGYRGDCSGNTCRTEVLITVPTSDTSWNGCVGTLGTCPYFVHVYQNDIWAGNLAAHPNTVAYGRSISSAPSVQSNPITKLGDSGDYSIYSALVDLRNDLYPQFTFVLRKRIGETFAYSLLAHSVMFYPGVIRQGQYFGYEGSLGAAAGRLFATMDSNPSRPAYDGFGMLTGWVPPTDPALFGSAGDSGAAMRHYVERARATATEATTAVSGAFDNLLKETQDENARLGEQAKANKISDINRRALCGDQNPNCDTTVLHIPLVLPTNWPDCSAASKPEENIRCMTKDMFRALANDWAFARPVALRVNDSVPPTFDDYAGGALQGAFLNQWTAARQVLNERNALLLATETAVARMIAAETAFNISNEKVKFNCDAKAMEDAERSCHSTSESVGVSVGVSVGFPSGGSVSESFSYTSSHSYSVAPKIAQERRCQELAIENQIALPSLVASAWESYMALGEHAARLTKVAADFRQSANEISRLLTATKLANEQAGLDAQLMQYSQATSFGLYRRYHNYDIWRAKALLENARRYAATARRAVESRLIVDLSGMNAPEAFVAAPASWADEVYTYDLSLPAAVGLSTSSQSGSPGIYPNKVLDYVGNLEKFIDGFAVSRPTAVANTDKELVTLPGLERKLPEGVSELKDPHGQKWSVLCNKSKQWVPVPLEADPTTICGANDAPIRARIMFSLDPWGRLNGDTAQEPFAKRYNVRWGQFGINLVGTGIRDCSKASEPMDCYNSPFLRFNLSHVAGWVSDYEGNWRNLAFPIGRSEAGKALASELWIEATGDSWSSPKIEAVSRREFSERPVGGTYQLEIDVGPEVRLDRLERVQLLMDAQYWIKQN